MLAALITLTLVGAPASATVELRPGRPIQFDGRFDDAEWSDAAQLAGGLEEKSPYTVAIKRQGEWLALGVRSTAKYRGEILNLVVGDPLGAWMTQLLFGLGNPAHPPALWRRSSPAGLKNASPLAGMESPRAVRARLAVTEEDAWSAEYHIRVSSLGIGRGDLRKFTMRVVIDATRPKSKLVFSFPGPGHLFDVSTHAALTSPDGFGRNEKWNVPDATVAAEFDDNEFLTRLFREHVGFTVRGQTDALVIASAVRPRTEVRIGALRRRIEEARRRNPAFPGWHYYLGRLLHEANSYVEARKLVESIPPALKDTLRTPTSRPSTTSIRGSGRRGSTCACATRASRSSSRRRSTC